MIPLWLKLVYTAFLFILVPVYWRRYGPGNFLWFSDIALLVTAISLWLESSLLNSMMALAVLVPEIAWNLDYFFRLLSGKKLIGLSSYMFDPYKSKFLRGLSLFHVVLPGIIIWLLIRLGYHPFALPAQTILSWMVLPATYFFTDPAENINWVFGPGEKPQKVIHPLIYLLLAMAFFPLCLYLPLHLLFSAFFYN